MQHVHAFDHAIILVRDLDDAETRMTRLGFRPTPRALHSAAMGTANTTVMLGDGTYFETLAVTAPTPANAAARARLAEREGLFGLAMKTDDARAAGREFAAAGLGPEATLDFARPVELPGGASEARFTIARTDADALPGAWLFVCQHHTPEVTWRPDYLAQPNGATGVAEVVGIADDPAALAPSYAAVFGPRLRVEGGELIVATGTAVLRFQTPAGFAKRFGVPAGAIAGNGPRLAALCVRVGETAPLGRRLEAAAVRFVITEGGGLVVPPGDACGTVIAFVA